VEMEESNTNKKPTDDYNKDLKAEKMIEYLEIIHHFDLFYDDQLLTDKTYRNYMIIYFLYTIKMLMIIIKIKMLFKFIKSRWIIILKQEEIIQKHLSNMQNNFSGENLINNVLMKKKCIEIISYLSMEKRRM
jgi:hypothetical protein